MSEKPSWNWPRPKRGDPLPEDPPPALPVREGAVTFKELFSIFPWKTVCPDLPFIKTVRFCWSTSTFKSLALTLSCFTYIQSGNSLCVAFSA